MPNYAGTLTQQSRKLPLSYLELSRPTGKYIARIWLAAVNFFFKKGFIRVVGNTCAPGVYWADIEPELGFGQFGNSDHNCGALVVNVMNHKTYADAVGFVAEPYMVFECKAEWNQLTDALAAMSSKYRVRNQKVLKSTADFSWRELQDQPASEWLSTCSRFLQQTLAEKTVALTGNFNELLWQYHSILKQNFKVRGYYLNHELIGFISYIEDGHEWHAMHMGIYNPVGEQYPLYQRMFLDLIDSAIAAKTQRLYMGRTATEIKSTLGAIALDNQFLVFVKFSWLRYLTRLYKRFVYRAPGYTLRRPFK
ncbi:MAG: hypothetical protein RL577_1087 [Bacteroidota bacterium]